MVQRRKGLGCIAPDEGGKDFSSTAGNIAGEGSKSLPENAKVEFEGARGLEKGPEATERGALI